MKLTKETLKQIIKEELEATMEEGFFDNVFGKVKKRIGKGRERIGKGADFGGYDDGKALGRKHGKEGQPEKSDDEIVKIGEEYCKKEDCSVDKEYFIKGYKFGYRIGNSDFRQRQSSSEPEKRQYDDGDVPDYERHDYDQRYRDAMSASGVGVGALSMPSDRKKPVS
jgi:hypothetical protein